MGVVLHRHHGRFISTLIIFSFLLLFSSSAAVTTSSHNRFSGGLEQRKKGLPGRIVDQKRLSGPGSAPPKCKSKCEKCEPCKAVHVPIQPGLNITPLQYYPEAWRCKCGNKLFRP